MLKEIAMHTGEKENSSYSNISCYLGNVHISPITRMLKTYNSDGVHSGDLTEESDFDKKRKSVLLSKRRKKVAPAYKKQDFALDYIKLSQMRYNIDEPAEEKIAK